MSAGHTAGRTPTSGILCRIGGSGSGAGEEKDGFCYASVGGEKKREVGEGGG